MSIVPLVDAGPECGRKAHGLAALLRAGLPVPDGFVVTDPAVDPRLVAERLRRLGGRAVAVRSSGLVEDSATASFAGQLDTVLGARGADEVLTALRRCASSPHTDRARGYRAHLGLDDEPAAPVLVQDLVEADHAGVLFTRDPRTGADAVVINACWGLGESVASGAVVPDEIIVTDDRIRTTVGAKQTRLDLCEHGLERSPVAEPDRARACVPPGKRAGSPHSAGGARTSSAGRRTSSGRFATTGSGCCRPVPSPPSAPRRSRTARTQRLPRWSPACPAVPAGRGDRHASSARSTTSPACGPATSSCAGPPTRPGPRCSASPPRS
jgi:hypothetical protein